MIAIIHLNRLQRKYLWRINQLLFQHGAQVFVAYGFFAVSQILEFGESRINRFLVQLIAEIDQLLTEGMAAGVLAQHQL
ncbi:hypothetical protein D3C80_1778080 [compost metagenome]